MSPLQVSLIGYPIQFDITMEILKKCGISCLLQEMTWEGAWENLAEIALYCFGPDVSQIGTT